MEHSSLSITWSGNTAERLRKRIGQRPALFEIDLRAQWAYGLSH